MNILPDMGEYGAYVWPSYLAVFGVLGFLAVQSWRWQRRVQDEAAQLKAERRAAIAEKEKN